VWEEFAEKNNKELMNSIGNLYNRILKVATKDFNQTVPPLPLN
jgi:methionyl-tRNA synthetase